MKLITTASMIFNAIVWLSTFESSRVNLREARPSVKAELASVAAAKKETDQKEAAEKTAHQAQQAKAQEVANEKTKADRELAAAVVLNEKSLIAADLLYRDSSNTEYRVYMMLQIWKTPPTDIEPNRWMSRIVLSEQPKFENFNVYLANPEVLADGSVDFKLERSDMQKLYNASATVSVYFKHLNLRIGADKSITATIDDQEDNQWKKKITPISLLALKTFEGEWSGAKIKKYDRLRLGLALTSENDLLGELTIPDSDHAGRFCYQPVRAHMVDQETILLFVGRRAPHSTSYDCFDDFVIRAKVRDGKVIYGDTHMSHEAIPDKVEFTKAGK